MCKGSPRFIFFYVMSSFIIHAMKGLHFMNYSFSLCPHFIDDYLRGLSKSMVQSNSLNPTHHLPDSGYKAGYAPLTSRRVNTHITV